MQDDDEALLERIRQGDGESFGLLYDRTRGWLLDFVIKPRIGTDDAEDVLSETFRTALTKIRTFQWSGVPLVHWLASIAKRKSLERLRTLSPAALLQEPAEALFEIPDPVPTIEAELIRADHINALKDRVHTTLEKLPARYTEALRLRLLEGRERSECARVLGVSVSTFDVVLYRATRAFAREWRRL